MERSTNALAELAFRIDAAHTEMIASEVPKQYCEYIKKAQRIVHVLGMVFSNERSKPWLGESVEAVEKCRAIAEEGAGDA